MSKNNRILNLGCGYKKNQNEIGIDIIKTPFVDIIGDAHHLPFRDNSFDEIHAYHVLEHLDFIKSFNEIYRVLKPRGLLKARVPHAFSPWFYDNPTHRTPFTSWTLKFVTEWDEFNLQKKFMLRDLKLSGKMAWLFNLNLSKFEKILRLFPWNYELEFKLEVNKREKRGFLD